MVDTIKFSEFVNGGDLEPNQTTVGLESGVNVRFSNPFPLLPPGTTGDRPVPNPVMYYRLRFNTTTLAYEYYEPLSNVWIEIEDSASVLPLLASHLPGEGASLIGLQDQGGVLTKTVQDLANSSIVAKSDDGTLVNGFFLETLPTGFVSVTTATGDINSRTLTGTANQINISNGTGLSGNPVFSLSSTMNLPGTFNIQSTTAINGIINDNTMASATATNVPTSSSIVAYIASVIGSAAAGSTGNIQYNNGGAFAANSAFTTDGAGNVTLTGNMTFSTTKGIYDVAGLPFLKFIQSASSDTWLTLTNGTGGAAVSIGADAIGATAGISFAMKGSTAYGFKGSTTKGAEIQWFEQTTIGTNAIAIRAPATVTTPYTLVMPDVPPTVSGQVKTVTTAGVETWSGIAIAATNGISFGSGGGTLNYYQARTAFSPGASFATNGDTSVVYTTQTATSTRIGDMVNLNGTLAFIATYSTAASFFQITNIPFAPAGTVYGVLAHDDANLIYPAGRSEIFARIGGGATVMNIAASGSAVASTILTISNILSGVAYQFRFNITYQV